MRSKVLELVVGLFVVIGLGALLVLALNVSGLTPGSQKETYSVYARFDNIGGLTARSKVTLAGVKIGEVKAITIDTQRMQALVELAINDDVNFLSTDSSASILTAGLLGEQYIGIMVGAEEEVLKAGDTIFDTQSAVVLEDLISKFLFNQVSE